jgi:hypothetical protein
VNEPKAERQVALPIPKLDESRNFKLDMIAIKQLEVQIYRSVSHTGSIMTNEGITE